MAINDWTDPADWASDASPWSEFWLGGSDGLSLSLGETAVNAVAILASDTLGVLFSEVQTSLLSLSRVDTLTTSVGESQSSLLTSLLSDALSLSITAETYDVVSEDWPQNAAITNTWTPKAALVSTETTL